MTGRAFVVGVAGTPGSGKTAMVRLLSRTYRDARAVSYDDFHPGLSDEEITAWLARGGEPDELELAPLMHELERRTRSATGDRRRELILFETAFGRAHRATGAFIDFLVWIDTPLDIALSRACLVFLDPAQGGTEPEETAAFTKWLGTYMRGYPMLHRMYSIVKARAVARADLVVDGTQAPDVLAAAVIEALAARGLEP